MIAKVREKLAVSKQAAQKFDMERFNLSNLSRALVNGVMNLRVLSNAGNFLTENWLISQEGLCSME